MVGGLGRFQRPPVVVLGTERGSDTESRVAHNFGMARPEGYRKARRLIELAGRFELPLLTFVDTAGAFPGIEAEARGQAEAIARSIEACLEAPVPIVATIIGEGGSGGAIALAAGDRVLMLEHSVYSVISPEGCACILWRDAAQAPTAAEALRLTAQDLHALRPGGRGGAGTDGRRPPRPGRDDRRRRRARSERPWRRWLGLDPAALRPGGATSSSPWAGTSAGLARMNEAGTGAIPGCQQPQPDTPSSQPDGLFFRVFPSICLPMFLASVDDTIVATALPNIAGSLGDVERVSWVVVAYLMATTIAAPVYGRLGDALGRKRLLFVALACSSRRPAACAVAPTMLLLIGARVLQGAGGGGLMTLSPGPGRRGRAPAGARALPGLPGRRLHGVLHLRPGGRRLADAAFRLAVGVPGQPAARRAGAAAGLAPAAPGDRPAALRFDWLGLRLFASFVVALLLALERAQRLRRGAAGHRRLAGAWPSCRWCCCCGRSAGPRRRSSR